MYITIQDDQGVSIWEAAFDFVEGDDVELVKELNKTLKKLERMGIVKLDNEG